uniref:Proopiomelanocortin n=1 Tax=Labrus bergylta TaxID=56723 RepID=A0A3Q3M7Q6_9LABR
MVCVCWFFVVLMACVCVPGFGSLCLDGSICNNLNEISQSILKSHSNQRRSYSMEHFRWGKPTGRKRRPVKVFASSLEGGSSFEDTFPFQARRQLSINEEEANASKPQTQLSAQHRKDGTYRMSHFRWGSPPPSKRNSSLMKTWKKKPQGQLAGLFRNIFNKNAQRVMEARGQGTVSPLSGTP